MKLLFGADLVPTSISEKYFINKDFKTLFGKVLDIIPKYDRFIVNFECTLTTEEKKIKKYGPALKAHPSVADALKELGVTDAMLSNNHVFDFGIKGLRDTMENLNRVGIPFTGIGENDQDSRKIYYVEKDGKKVGIVNVCEHEYSYATADRIGCNPYVPFETMRDIKKAKENADFVVVIYHGGKEYCRYPSPRLREHCREMVLSGADVVLTQHSHCIGCYEEYEGGHILYGQGNLHFVAKSNYPEWYTSLIVGIEFTDKVKMTFYPTYQTEVGIELAEGEKANEIISDFEKRNAELKDGTWLNGWDDFCNRFADGYKYCMSAEYAKDFGEEMGEQVKAHYLDCEAHLDVIKHLYKSWNYTNK